MKAEHLLKRLGIAYTCLTKKQIIEHKQAWVHRLIPPDKQQKAIECYCLPSDDGFSDYLWHAFSFELLDGLRGDNARIALCSVKNDAAILLSNWDDAGFHVSDTIGLTAATLEEIDDVVLTNADFKWTYAKTHEPDLGPYFYKIKLC